MPAAGRLAGRRAWRERLITVPAPLSWSTRPQCLRRLRSAGGTMSMTVIVPLQSYVVSFPQPQSGHSTSRATAGSR